MIQSLEQVLSDLVAAVTRRHAHLCIRIDARQTVLGRDCIETLDECIGKIVDACRSAGVDLLITADHGNAERMHDGNGAHTAHTNNLVPLVHVGRATELASGGTLVDIAPTLLALLGIEQPAEMTGRSLVKLDDASQDAA